MEENVSRFVTAIIAVFIMFVFPVYTAYEKKDDISYALAVRYTQEFVDNIRKKGYITAELYNDYKTKLLATGNTYSIELEHEYVRYDGNYVDKTVGSAARNTELFTNDHIINILNNGQVYTMNKDDNFNVKIKNTNVTLATVIYNIVTVNTSSNNVRIYVDYGGRILAEKWYEQGLKYSEYGGIVDKNGYNIDVVIDWDKEIDEEYTGNGEIDSTGNVGIDATDSTENFLSNNVKIGDYVEYYPNVTNTAYGGYTRYTDIKWRVLSIDKANDKVTLISESVAAESPFPLTITEPNTDSTTEVEKLANTLDTVCDKLFSFSITTSGKTVGDARNVTKEDLDNVPENMINELVYIGTTYPLSTIIPYQVFSEGDSYNSYALLAYYGKKGYTAYDLPFGANKEANEKLWNPVYLRPVVELSKETIINYEIGGCSDSARACGTKENPWKMLLNETQTLKDVAEVGDYVNFVSDSETTSITIPAEINGYGSQTISKSSSVKWRALDVNEDKVVLISDYIGEIRFSGATGYNNAVDVLNNICSTLYSMEGIATARSINVNDVMKYGNFDHTDTYKTYELPTGSYPIRLDSSEYIGSNPTRVAAWESKMLGKYITGTNTSTLNGISKMLVTTSIEENIGSNDLLGKDSNGNTGTYWLASLITRYYSASPNDEANRHDYMYFGLRSLTSYDSKIQLGYSDLYCTRWRFADISDIYNFSKSTSSYRIRAIVELDADTRIDSMSLGNGNKSTPWILR